MEKRAGSRTRQNIDLISVRVYFPFWASASKPDVAICSAMSAGDHPPAHCLPPLPSFCPPLTPSAFSPRAYQELFVPGALLLFSFATNIKLFQSPAPCRLTEVREINGIECTTHNLLHREKLDKETEWEERRIRLVSDLRIQFAVFRVLRFQSISQPRSSALLMSPSRDSKNKGTPSSTHPSRRQ